MRSVNVINRLSDINTISGVNVIEHPNQPAGATTFFNHPFDVIQPTGWLKSDPSNNLSIISDSTAPKSPSNILAGKYPAGFVGGSAPFNLYRQDFSAQRIYIHTFFKISAAFDSHTVGTKFFFLADRTQGGATPFYAHFNGAGTNALFFEIRTQGAQVITPTNYGRNVGPGGSTVITRNIWHEFEFNIKINTVGSANGEINVWINKVKTHEYLNVQFVNAGSNRLDGFEYNPTYGGGNTYTVPADQYFYMDNFYMSGINA